MPLRSRRHRAVRSAMAQLRHGPRWGRVDVECAAGTQEEEATARSRAMRRHVGLHQGSSKCGSGGNCVKIRAKGITTTRLLTGSAKMAGRMGGCAAAS